MNNYVTIGRTSTGEQKIETQINECLKRIRFEENGKEFNFKVFLEDGVTSTIPMKKRPILQEFLEFLKSGDIVIVYELSRLARDFIEMVTLYRQIRAMGCKIISVTESWAESEMVVGIIGSVAQEERTRLKRRIKDHHAGKIKDKERCSGILPYGYSGLDQENLIPVKSQKGELAPGKLIPCPEETRVIEVMRTLSSQGMGLSLLTQTLTDMGYRNRQGNPFHRTSIKRILARYEIAPQRELSPENRELDLFQKLR